LFCDKVGIKSIFDVIQMSENPSFFFHLTLIWCGGVEATPLGFRIQYIQCCMNIFFFNHFTRFSWERMKIILDMPTLNINCAKTVVGRNIQFSELLSRKLILHNKFGLIENPMVIDIQFYPL